MKKIILTATVMMISLLSINEVKAQINTSVNINSQPLWGPINYDYVEYYYLPDINAYYHVPSGQYICLINGRWQWVNSLPSMYNNFNLYNSYKVVINNSESPYLQNNIHQTQYGKYKNYGNNQPMINDSQDSKYSSVKGKSTNTTSRANTQPASNQNSRSNNNPSNNQNNKSSNNNQTVRSGNTNNKQSSNNSNKGVRSNNKR